MVRDGGGQGVRVDHGQGSTCVMGVAGSGVTSQAVALKGFRTLGQQEGPLWGLQGAVEYLRSLSGQVDVSGHGL